MAKNYKHLKNIGIKKQGLNVVKVQACLRLWQLMPAVCRSEAEEQRTLNVRQWNACIPIGWLTGEVCQRKTGLNVGFDNLCPQFAERNSKRYLD